MPFPTADKLIRHVSLRQLQIFETVARLGSYTRAAEELQLTQPTVSMQIKKLGETLGHPLLEQQGRRIKPTMAGEEVFKVARDILDRMLLLGEATAELDNVVKGPLRIAVITTAKYFMPHILGSFIARYPEVEPRLTVTNRSKVIERLKSNEDDFLIMGQVPDNLAVEAYPFIDNELVVVAHTDHPLTRKKNISLDELSQHRFVVRETGSGTRMAVDRLFEEQGLEINPFMELGSSEAIKQAVMAGLGLSVLSRHNLRLELEANQIAILDVEGFPLIRSWYAVHFKNKQLSLVPRTFLDFLLRQGKDMLHHIPG